MVLVLKPAARCLQNSSPLLLAQMVSELTVELRESAIANKRISSSVAEIYLKHPQRIDWLE